MIGNPSYRSFLVRLWREAGAEDDVWRGEVEHIQGGAVVAVASLEAVFDLIRRAVAKDEEREPGPGPPMA
ncbi:MAG: hypothetical protein KIS91_11145 [Anaerolineae bacterium]|nr:hypothetical protein [Anaerolineae bacterium]